MKLIFLFGAAYCLAQPLQYVGTNLAGADFGESNLPGEYDVDYTYPIPSEVDYFMSRGMNTFRINFRWERLQRSQFAGFDATELSRLTNITNYATGRGAYVLLDPHNYARYFYTIVGQGVPYEAWQDFWRRLAGVFVNNQNIIFGVVNEPHTMPTEIVVEVNNAAIRGIREAGATQLILGAGNAWTGAHSWLQDWYGTPNAVLMGGVSDPLNNFAWDMHQYLDSDNSGTNPQCLPLNGRLNEATNWLRMFGYKALIGEFAGANNPACESGIHDMLYFMEANRDVWIGWTWWAAGPWWGEYMYTIEPYPGGGDRPQMNWLRQHLPGTYKPPNKYD